MATIEDFTGN
jgi:hypothetical protein